jgi:glycerol-3-phosphate dehydrogenase
MKAVEIIDGKKARELEPNINATSALLLGTTGIIDSAEYVNTLARLAMNNGVEILKQTDVIDVLAEKTYFTLKTDSRGDIDVKYLINAAGLYSDDIARKINPEQQYKVSPVRGEYYSFDSNKKGLEMKINIYPAPKPNTLGIHLTPTFDNGKVIVGPTAIDINDKENYMKDRKDRQYFFKAVKDFFPNLKAEDLKEDFTGIRAKLEGVYDFVIKTDEKYPNCLHLVGIDSPGLTSSLAIGKRVRVEKGRVWFEEQE